MSPTTKRDREFSQASRPRRNRSRRACRSSPSSPPASSRRASGNSPRTLSRNEPNLSMVQHCSAMLTAATPPDRLRRPPPTSPHETSTPMDLHLRGKRALITGASKGIGAAAAEAFAEEGCNLVLAARSGDQLKALCDRLRSAHQIDATAHVTDLRKPE